MNKPDIAQVERIIERCRDIGAANVMREDETARGNIVIKPGERPWFSAEEWSKDSVVSQSDSFVRLIAISAKRPNNGAFRRLIIGIIEAGLKPVVVAPFAMMTDILMRWDWRMQVIGATFDDREVRWFPQKKFITAYPAMHRNRAAAAENAVASDAVLTPDEIATLMIPPREERRAVRIPVEHDQRKMEQA